MLLKTRKGREPDLPPRWPLLLCCRSGLVNLAPTSTGSATAIALIFPELKGKLNGLAIRVPLTNSSITDCVFELAKPTTVEEVNRLLQVSHRKGWSWWAGLYGGVNCCGHGTKRAGRRGAKGSGGMAHAASPSFKRGWQPMAPG